MPRLLTGFALLLALAGCGGSAERARRAPEPPPADVVGEAVERRAPACVPGTERPRRTPAVAWAAVAQRHLRAYRSPDGPALSDFAPINVNGVPTVLGVLAEVLDERCRPAWYRVQLPRKPNGVEGYVRAAAVGLASVRTRILVDLSARRVTLYRDGREVLSTPAAIGSPATPTPTGSYYVNQRLRPADPSGPFGPGAIGISAFSEVLTGWAQGGPIAIHGTNRPDLIGRAVSNGCVRVRNDVLERLFDATLAGTPVEVRA